MAKLRGGGHQMVPGLPSKEGPNTSASSGLGYPPMQIVMIAAFHAALISQGAIPRQPILFGATAWETWVSLAPKVRETSSIHFIDVGYGSIALHNFYSSPLPNCHTATPVLGELQILGRLDHQVKVDGVRVDVGEMEACLRELPRVVTAAARAWELPLDVVREVTKAPSSSGQQTGPSDSIRINRTFIVAYVVLAKADDASSEEFRSGLAQEIRMEMRRRLPPAAVPGHVEFVPSLPLTSSGKLLRSELPRPLWMSPSHKGHPTDQEDLAPLPSVATSPDPTLVGTQPDGSDYSMHVSGTEGRRINMGAEISVRPLLAQHHGSVVTEAAVMTAFCRALGGRRDLEPNDDFFVAGGTSLAAAQVAAELGTDPALMYIEPCTARRLAALMGATSSPFPAEGTAFHGTNYPSAAVQIAPGLAASPVAKSNDKDDLGVPRANKRQKTGEVDYEDLEHGDRMDAACIALLVERWRHSLHRSHGLVTLTGASRTTTLTIRQGLPAANPICQSVSNLPVCKQDPSKSVDSNEEPHQPSSAIGLKPSTFSPQERTLSVAWSYPLGRCIDASPILVKLKLPQRKSADGQPRLDPEIHQLKGTCSTPQCPSSTPDLIEVILACSHDGSVACLDHVTGQSLWHVKLPGRAEAGMCVIGYPSCNNDDTIPGSVLPDTIDVTRNIPADTLRSEDVGSPFKRSDVHAAVAVACGDDRVHFLDLLDGGALGRTPPLPGGLRAAPAVDPWPGCGLAWMSTHGRELVAISTPCGRILSR